MKTFGRVSTAGIELVVSTLIGFFGGRWVDGQLGTEPWFRWIGLFLGLVAGFRSLYQVARRTQRELERSDRKHEDEG